MDETATQTKIDGRTKEGRAMLADRRMSEPRDDSAIAEMQAQIDELKSLLESAVAKPRDEIIPPGNGIVPSSQIDAGIKRLGTHPEDPIASGKTRILVSDSQSLTVILRPSIEGLDGSGGKYTKHPALKVQFDHCQAVVDEALLPLLKNHPSWNAQGGGVFDPLDPGSPRGRRSGPQVVEGVATGVRPESDMEPLPRWDTREVDELVRAINEGQVHHMDVINWEGRPSGRKRPAVLEAATARLMSTASVPDETPLEAFSAQIPGEA